MTTLVPLSTSDHAGLKFQPAKDLSDIRNQHLVPIYSSEITVLGRLHPIVITRLDSESSYGLSILCSLTEKAENVSITSDGKWVGPHVPAFIRQRPFDMVLSKDDQKVLCADIDSPQLGTEGIPLFEEGEPTKFLKQVRDFLSGLFDNGVMTRTVLDSLGDLELIAPLEITLKDLRGDVSTLQGMFRIDEEKLNQCDDESWLQLKNAGAIPLIYGHLWSLGHIQSLADILRRKDQQTELADSENLNFLFGMEDDNLNFEGL